MSVARRWGTDPAAVERWPADLFAAACDLLASEELERRRQKARSKARRGKGGH